RRPRIDPVRGNLVALKRLLRQRIDYGCKPSEIPAAPQLIGNRRANKGGCSLPQPFVVPEEKCPVLDDPSACGKAKFVARKRRFRYAGMIGVVRVKNPVLIELKDGTVQLVCAGLGNHSDGDRPVEFRLLTVRVHAKLADGIDRGTNL